MKNAFRRVLAGESFRAVASELGIDESTLRRRMRAAGLAVDRPRGQRAAVADDQAVAAWREHRTVEQAAAALGVSETAIRNALHRAGMQRRTRHPERFAVPLSPEQEAELQAAHDAMPDGPRPRSPDRESPEFAEFCALVRRLWVEHDISLATAGVAVGRATAVLSRWLREADQQTPDRPSVWAGPRERA